jgi:pSer/pThr/pTyr-binding forkhead associated (FHA) protein
MVQIIIRHLSGARATELDVVPVGEHRELIFGRARSAAVRFHPQQDQVVGRFHARVVPFGATAEVFMLSDLGSRNGTFLNGERIQQPMVIQSGDRVRFGEGGPEVEFQVEGSPDREEGR